MPVHVSDLEPMARVAQRQRAAHEEHWRQKARELFPEITDPDEIQLKARQLEREKLVAAGRKGAETYRQRAEQQRIFSAQLDDMISRTEELLQLLRSAERAA